MGALTGSSAGVAPVASGGDWLGVSHRESFGWTGGRRSSAPTPIIPTLAPLASASLSLVFLFPDPLGQRQLILASAGARMNGSPGPRVKTYYFTNPLLAVHPSLLACELDDVILHRSNLFDLNECMAQNAPPTR